MLTNTTITAIRSLVHVGLHAANEPLSIGHIARDLGESPTYLAKVANHLVKAGILRAHRGVMGGVSLARPANLVTLQAIVEACQGTILADFCQETRRLSQTCAFHVASAELHEAIIAVLSRWTLDQFLCRPAPTGALQGQASCLMRVKLPSPTESSAKKSRSDRAKGPGKPAANRRQRASG